MPTLPMVTFSPLNADILAHLFLQLAQMEQAGLSATQAFGLLDYSNKTLKPRLVAMRRQVQAGNSIAESGFKAGIFDDNTKALIAAAENGGKLASVYKQLADYYLALSERLQRIRSRLVLPTAILILALLVQPLPALVTGAMTGGEYVARIVGTLAVLAGIGFSALRLPAFLCRLGLKTAWDGLLLQLPAVANWVVTRQLNEFFFMLALLLDAGLPFSEALPRAVATIENSVLQARFAPAVALCHSGASVATALGLVPAIKSNQLQIITSGEHSGKLADTLLHFNRIEAESIALQNDQLAEWLPRLVYAVIAGWMAYSILTSGAFMPH